MSDYERWNNLPRTKALRRRLRAQMTTAESTLWKLLKSRRIAGPKFRRQHGVGSYNVDFYCAEARLVVEVDGGIHNDPARAEADALRQSEVEKLGLQEVRYTNDEVLEQADLVCQVLVHGQPVFCDIAARAWKPQTQFPSWIGGDRGG
ncbi:MAG: endonuclease domain-containing protein [Bacteroidota bacterium]